MGFAPAQGLHAITEAHVTGWCIARL